MKASRRARLARAVRGNRGRRGPRRLSAAAPGRDRLYLVAQDEIATASNTSDDATIHRMKMSAFAVTRFNGTSAQNACCALVPLKRVTAANADIFILWMVASSLVLLAVAILFLRNQVKPIERLAAAAENFGKGRAVPDFKPHGASEVRGAAEAFIQMRDRIERYVQQRTEMLAGVSHDLKTPLTRIRLQLALMKKDTDTEAIAVDLAEMERMLNEYLDFARGEGGEAAEPADLGALVEETVADAARARDSAARVKLISTAGITLAVKRNALKRCLANLIDNALKYGTHVEVALRRTGNSVEIAVDDDGQGIPEARREEAFRPFHRLDEGRNLQSGGVGLGLAIARDIARGHGGDVALGESPLGGLRAVMRLPV